MATAGVPPVALIVLLSSLWLSGCTRQDAADPGRADDGALSQLPVPEAGRGSVTGMPAQPGPGAIGAPDTTGDRRADVLDGDGNPLAPAQADGTVAADGDAATSGLPSFGDEPGAQEAVAVVREYYAALDSGSFASAYRLWSENGVATGQSPQQFADSFAATAAQSVEFMTPGRIDAAAGSRYIEVPVAIEVTRRDGAVQRFAGAYTLRRAAIDDASAEQRTWRIVSADLREVRP